MKIRHSDIPAHLATKTLLRLPEVLALLGVKKSHWYSGIAKGIYPRPVKIGLRVSAWPAPVIDEVLDRLTHSKS